MRIVVSLSLFYDISEIRLDIQVQCRFCKKNRDLMLNLYYSGHTLYIVQSVHCTCMIANVYISEWYSTRILFSSLLQMSCEPCIDTPIAHDVI